MPLALRLLSACRQTYNITGDGPVSPIWAVGPSPATSGAGWTVAPKAAVAGICGQDAAFVGVMGEGVVVAIRGTTATPEPDPARWLVDWAGDAVAPLVATPDTPGRVHWGFWQASLRLWAQLAPLVDQAVRASSVRAILVTGHSKGGALCPLIAWRAAQAYPDHQITVRAFAPARVGDDVFADAYNARIPDHVRYEFDADVVPHLPADPALNAALGAPAVLGHLLARADLGYGSVGKLAYIQADGSITGDSAGLERARIASLLERLTSSGGLDYVAECHSVDDPSAGYVRAAYPT